MLPRAFTVRLSGPKNKNLSSKQRKLLSALEKKIVEAGLNLAINDDTTSLKAQSSVIRNCQGVLATAFSQWEAQRLWRKGPGATFPTEFNHIDVALAEVMGKPLLGLVEEHVTKRGVLRPGLINRVVEMPEDLNPDWLNKNKFQRYFKAWLNEVNGQSHLFFGYSGAASGTANQIQLWLLNQGFKVIDWKNFRPGESILTRLEEAVNKSACGVFLFTADDIKIKGNMISASPRDNVIFEAGYFSSMKGKARTLIILETGAAIPADLGGDIYLKLGNRDNVSSIEGRLSSYLEEIFRVPQ